MAVIGTELPDRFDRTSPVVPRHIDQPFRYHKGNHIRLLAQTADGKIQKIKSLPENRMAECEIRNNCSNHADFVIFHSFF